MAMFEMGLLMLLHAERRPLRIYRVLLAGVLAIVHQCGVAHAQEPLEKGAGKLTITYYGGDETTVKKMDDGLKKWIALRHWDQKVTSVTGATVETPAPNDPSAIVATVRIESYKVGNLNALIAPFAGANEIVASVEIHDRHGHSHKSTFKIDSRPVPGGPPILGSVEERLGAKIAAEVKKFAEQ